MLYLMCRVLVKSRDLAVQSQLGESLRMMLETQQDQPDIHVSQSVVSGCARFLMQYSRWVVLNLYSVTRMRRGSNASWTTSTSTASKPCSDPSVIFPSSRRSQAGCTFVRRHHVLTSGQNRDLRCRENGLTYSCTCVTCSLCLRYNTPSAAISSYFRQTLRRAWPLF